MAKRSMFVGLDVHKDSIDISVAEEGRDGEVRHYGGIPGDLEPLAKVLKALRAPNRRLRFVYEAGPCGFGIYRYLTSRGEECVVVSPSSMPKRSGDRIKTDRRDGEPARRSAQSNSTRHRQTMSCGHPVALEYSAREVMRWTATIRALTMAETRTPQAASAEVARVVALTTRLAGRTVIRLRDILTCREATSESACVAVAVITT